jgi:Putative prokaryotic signal transducing protein
MGRTEPKGAPVDVAAVASSTIEAQIIVGLLEANGISAVVSADDAGGMEPQWQLTDGVRVLVRPEDLERAKELIAERDG